jgi:hypothetical protein
MTCAAGAAVAGPEDDAAQQALARIEKASDAATRDAATAELGKLAPKAIDGITAFLARPHGVELADRRKVLEAIHAQVPDKAGRFTTPERKSAKEEQADDNLDWMAALVALPGDTPGLGEVIADDAALRALASTKDIKAADVVFDTAFGADTIIYRDECGRYLRKMEPYSIPSLIVQSQSKDFDRKRYATYQLERMDRQEPGHALAAAAGDEGLTIAILDAFRTTHYREAVHAVWTKVPSDSLRVRTAARAAWDAYITGPAPPPAPKKKLLLPGGKLTKKEKPLWLTYRELADNELRKAANELLQEDYPLEDPTLDDSDEFRHKKSVKVDLQDLTKRLFAYFDDARAKREADRWTAAKALADKGDIAGAAGALDRLLAATPEAGGDAVHGQMAAVYLAYGKDLEGKDKWAEASAAYSKAHGLDPSGAHATQALAASYYTLGKSLEAKGLDGGPEFRRAIGLDPSYTPAAKAEHEVERRGHPVWMLYGAAVAGGLAALLFAVGVARRRA